MGRGQTTVFVLIGIVLVLAVALVYLMARTPTVDAEFLPIEDHVRSCVRATALEGLQRMGHQGGYIALSPQEGAPTETDVLAVGSGQVPYWYYTAGNNACSSCLVTTLTPTKESMETQLGSFIEQQMSECLDFSLFPDFTVQPAAEKEAIVELLQDSVVIRYRQRIDVTANGEAETLEQLEEQLTIPFMEYYDVARRITQTQLQSQFLESFLLDMMSPHLGNELPPIAGYREGFTPDFWIRMNVQEFVDTLSQAYTPALVLNGSANMPVLPDLEDQYLDRELRKYVLDIPVRNDFSISFFRVGQPYVDVLPRQGELIMPFTQHTAGMLIVPPRTQQYYNFLYQISMPFLVEIRHEEFTFRFALEANIRDNSNMAEWLLGRGTIPWSDAFTELSVLDPETTEAAETQYAHNTSLRALLCDPSQFTSVGTVRTVDQNGASLPNVSLTFTCGHYASCRVGVTDAAGSYDGGLPPCQGGLLKAEASGYMSKEVRISSDESFVVPEMRLEQLRNVTVHFRKYPVIRNITTRSQGVELSYILNGTESPLLPDWSTNILSDVETLGQPSLLSENETAFATFIRVGAAGDGVVTATAIDGANATIDTIQLVPGLYELQVFYLDDTGRQIPANCTRECSERGLFGCSEHVYLPEDPINITPAPWGGNEFSAETRYWRLDRAAMTGSLEVPLYVAPPPLCLKDLETMGGSRSYARMFNLEPSFQ